MVVSNAFYKSPQTNSPLVAASGVAPILPPSVSSVNSFFSNSTAPVAAPPSTTYWSPALIATNNNHSNVKSIGDSVRRQQPSELDINPKNNKKTEDKGCESGMYIFKDPCVSIRRNTELE